MRSRRLLLAGIVLLFILVTIAAILLATAVQKGQS